MNDIVSKVSKLFQEGQTARVSLGDFSIENIDTGARLPALPVPPSLIDMMRRGGIFPLLEAEGLIAPKTDDPAGKEAAHP